MRLLNKLFASPEALAKEMAADENLIEKQWKDYLNTVPKKRTIIEHLNADNFHEQISELKNLLNLELMDIENEEKEDLELMADLEKTEHFKKIMRVHRLEQCLAYAETKHEYVYALLKHLFSVLKTEMRLLELNSVFTERTISKIKSQFELELEIIKKIEKIQTFHNLFTALAKGEYIIKAMDAKEKKLHNKMQKTFEKLFYAKGTSNKALLVAQSIAVSAKYRASKLLSDGMTKEAIHGWIVSVFEAIEDKVYEAVAKGIIEGYHSDIDFEFVNRKEFVELVREKAMIIGNKRVSEEKIKVFVYLFREWYNSR